MKSPYYCIGPGISGQNRSGQIWSDWMRIGWQLDHSHRHVITHITPRRPFPTSAMPLPRDAIQYSCLYLIVFSCTRTQWTRTKNLNSTATVSKNAEDTAKKYLNPNTIDIDCFATGLQEHLRSIGLLTACPELLYLLKRLFIPHQSLRAQKILKNV